MSRFLRPKKPTAWKQMTYECGSEPIGEANVQFRFQYYSFGIIFLIFDQIATFFLIWAVAFGAFSNSAILWGLVFMMLLFVGVAYALKREETIWI
ncbi:MAG: NADH-quinone oxidoreductase subunit A [Thermoplasmatales archaeon]|nr:NADH-quinone oxidoreductase subunit A [Thermoplasmatales archaeon]